MFKPLLRTLPTLSGNFTVSCLLNEFDKINTNEYTTYVRAASICPLQNFLFAKKIDINLLYNKYEYDVYKYYNYYSNYFYKNNFAYDKSNYAIIDNNNVYNSNNDSRNKDYEFGCKRLNYNSLNKQFNFYAPFYLDDFNDLPDYFCIKILINDNLEKTIKVYINKDNKKNYLKEYLKRYFKQMDNKVIFCLPQSNQATYFGLDIKRGGLVQYKDNVIGSIYNKQSSINSFDNIICQGFERNGLIMKQIFPISFSFNLNDIFNDYEKDFFIGSKINISGYYFTSGDYKYNLFDFDIDYTNEELLYRKYDKKTGKYYLDNGYDKEGGNPINVMNVGFPSLNESKYIKYAYTNKITPMYCKFKMLYSNDNDPYITNNSFAYSYIQYHNQKYGYFPTMFKGIIPKAVVENNDLKLPIGDNISYYTNNNYDKYNKLMTNYYSSWYNINMDNCNNMFDNDELWSDVQYDYTYHKGVLYNLKELNKYNIDKFGVFLDINLNKYGVNTNVEDINEIIPADLVISKNEVSQDRITEYDDSYIMKEGNKYKKIYPNIRNDNWNNYAFIDQIMKLDNDGTYVKEENYIKENKYYNITDIISIIDSKIANNEEIKNEIKNDNVKVTGYILLDVLNNANYFTKGGELFLNADIIKNKNKNDNTWCEDLLYFSTVLNDNKVLFKDNTDIVTSNEDTVGKLCMFIKTNLISEYDVLSILKNYNISLDKITSYMYKPVGYENDIKISNYFVPTNNVVNTYIYIDTYNIKSFLNVTDDDIEGNKQEFFIKFINKDHLKEYLMTLNYDENNESTISIDDYTTILDYIYIKQRNWYINSTSKTIYPCDIYVKLDEFLENNLSDYETLKGKLLKTTLNGQISWLINNLSDTRNGDNTFNFFKIESNDYKFNLDLCFKKKVYKIPFNKFKTVVDNNKFMYLYTRDNQCIDYVRNFDGVISREDVISNNLNIKDINDYLVPMFTSVYMNEHDILYISNLLNNGILKSYNSLVYYIKHKNSFYKEIDIDKVFDEFYKNLEFSENYPSIIETVIRKNYDEKEATERYNKLINDWYAYAKEHLLINSEILIYVEHLIEFLKEHYYDVCRMLLLDKITLYSIKNKSIQEYDKFSYEGITPTYLKDYNVYIYNHNNTTYCFYWISLDITNTFLSFNFEDDSIRFFDTINGINISDTSSYFKRIYYLIDPFLTINIFNEFTKVINTIVYPHESEITLNYMQSQLEKTDYNKYKMLLDNSDDILYKGVVSLNDTKKIKLLRYFNYITPLIKNTNGIVKDSWKLKFINNDNFYKNVLKCNILSKQDINIYNYDNIDIYDGVYDNDNCEYDKHIVTAQVEYKHFEDNLLYNLPECISIVDPVLYSEEDIMELSEDENLIKEKKIKILLKYFNKKGHGGFDYENIILFLFNKYNSNMTIEVIKSTSITNYIAYQIKYDFNLI